MPNVLRHISNENLDINECWLYWKYHFDRICLKHSPVKTVRVKNRHNPWMTHDILTLMYERDYLNRKAIKAKDNYLWERYKCARNCVVHTIKRAQQNYYKEQVCMHNGNKTVMWKTLKHILGGGNLTPDSFNEYFSQVGIKLANKLPDVPYDCKLPQSIHVFQLNAIHVNFIYEQLNLLKDKSNLDIINMDSRLLKLGASVIAPSITVLFNKSLSSGVIPNDWKCATVTPIYKGKGPIDQYGNYRPISVTSHFSKLIEKSVLFQLNNYLSSNDFLTCSQSAFRKNHSTTTAIHKLICDILDGFNENEITTTCFIDLQKCFEIIDHSILLKKLKMYGFLTRH